MNNISSFLTNYSGLGINRLDNFTSFCLLPLATGVGRKVNIVHFNENNEKLKFTAEKTSSLALRVLATLGAILLLPITILGLILRGISSSHTQQIKNEKKFSENRENLFSKVLPLWNKRIDIHPMTPKDKVTELMEITSTIDTILKEDLEIKLASFLNNFKDIFSTFLTDGKLNDSIKQIEYQDLVSLKKCLRLLAKRQDKRNFDSNEFLNFKLYHKILHQYYYTHFSVDHLLRNLREKKEIPSLGIKLETICNSDQAETEIQSIKEAFSGDLKPTQVTWVHGTQSPTIAAVAKSGGLVKPSGQLREDNGIAFCGENGNGSYGINAKAISGVPLHASNQAILYSAGGVGYNDQIGKECLISPDVVIEKFYAEGFNNWLEKLKNEQVFVCGLALDYTHNSSHSKNLYNFHRHMKILWTLEPELFEKKLIPKIKELSSRLDTLVYTNVRTAAASLKELMFDPVLTFKDKLPKYTEEDQKIIRSGYPVIFGATGIQLVENRPENSQEKVAVRVQNSICTEYAFRGNLGLGSDINFIFVPRSRISMTREYLVANNIQNIKICTIASLKIAQMHSEFLSKKERKIYTY